MIIPSICTSKQTQLYLSIYDVGLPDGAVSVDEETKGLQILGVDFTTVRLYWNNDLKHEYHAKKSIKM